MIDVHSHVLPSVDDGSDSFSTSLLLIKEEVKNGVDTIILTPHNKSGSFEKSNSEIINTFDKLKAEVGKKFNVQLLLGQEIYICDEFYDKAKSNDVISINNTKYILVEFNYVIETDILSHINKILNLGYIPVIAHIERYMYFDWNNLFDLKMMGALIQVNASSVVGKSGKKIQKIVLNAISSGLVDFVASDIHQSRKCYLKKAYKKVKKVAGNEIADKLFTLNAETYFNINR